jgi:L-Ala-D/L-Glu epimerase
MTSSPVIKGISLRVEREEWPLTEPFRTSGHTWNVLPVILVTLEKDGHRGQAEAAGIYFQNESADSMIRQIEPLQAGFEVGLSRESLQGLLPRGGARNALDCALWDLESKLNGTAAWKLADLEPPKPLLTTFGCGADTPDKMAAVARGYTHARAIKLKLTGKPVDADRVIAVRETRPDVWLGVDANQGFTRPFLEGLMPVLVRAKVSLIEQPFPINDDSRLDGFHSPIPVAADESLQPIEELPRMVGRFKVVNIKLDKSGGLTEALALARAANHHGLQAMVGNMIGTSLAMAPAILVGQLCQVVDLDGPIFLKADRDDGVSYADGMISGGRCRWGLPTE